MRSGRYDGSDRDDYFQGLSLAAPVRAGAVGKRSPRELPIAT